MNSEMPLLTLEKVSWRYAGGWLLKGIDLAIRSGEILCLLGPSGSGKTSLLRVVAGLETPDCGRVMLDGADLADLPVHRRNFGMMFQEFALFPHKDVFHNVAFGLEIRKIRETDKKNRVREMLRLVGLSGFEARRVDSLSGGERQRVALARSLAPEPKLLMLDEPLGSLDRELRDRLAGDLRHILKNVGVTAIFVTHDHAEAFTVADRVALLNEGRLEQVDVPERLYRSPKTDFVARFLGFKNRLRGRVASVGWVETEVGRIPVDTGGMETGQDLTLVLRPECARMVEEPESQSPAHFRLTGVVTGRRFEGRFYRVDLHAGERELSFDLPNHPPPPAEGRTLTLFLRKDAMVVLPEPGQGQ